MNLMICMRAEPEELSFLPEIAEFGAGIELGGYGLLGIQSEQDWEARFELHKNLSARFSGTVAVHGPFIGMKFGHIDHLIRDAVNRRLDMTFDAAVKLGATRVVLHSGHGPDIDLWGLQESWLKENIEFWKREIIRWADAGIVIAIENDVQTSPDLLVRLADGVDNKSLGLCMDIGHQTLFSELDATEWVRRMAPRLIHVHLHDNDGTVDRHWPIGRGTIDFEPFYEALITHAPAVTISLEVMDKMETKLDNLRTLAARFTPRSGDIGAHSHK